VSVDVSVLTGGVRVYATNLYSPVDARTLPNPNNTNTACLPRMNRGGTLTLDGNFMNSSCFSNQVRPRPLLDTVG
jgi:hypothetical protein